MPTIKDLRSMSPEEVRAIARPLAKTIAKKLVIGFVVTVVVTLAANAAVAYIEAQYPSNKNPE